MPARLKPAPAAEVSAALERLTESGGAAEKTDLRFLTKHYLALLEQRAPGKSVEVRVPPYAAVQVVEGIRHTRGTPPAVIETDAATWIAVATGEMTWSEAVDKARVRASGERTDLSAYLPL